MANKPLPSPEVLRQLLRYEPDTGLLFWRERPVEMFSSSARHKGWNARCAGKLALSTNHNAGYKCGPVNNKLLLAHRVVVALVRGEWPSGEVDHINGDRSDNRWENLRVVSHADNSRNRAMSQRNSSGAMGVYWNPVNQNWTAEIKHEGAKRHLGSFQSIREAKAARVRAQSELGFHENHGRR